MIKGSEVNGCKSNEKGLPYKNLFYKNYKIMAEKFGNKAKNEVYIFYNNHV